MPLVTIGCYKPKTYVIDSDAFNWTGAYSVNIGFDMFAVT